MNLPNNNPEKNIYDIVFVGGGISSTFTWQSLLQNNPGFPSRVAMFDKDGNFGRGLPYGKQTISSYLLNDNVSLVDEKNMLGFRRWLLLEKPKWLNAIMRQGNPVSFSWLNRHKGAIDRNDFDDLYLPRYVFGLFLQDRFEQHLKLLKQYNHEYSLLQDDVEDIERLSVNLFAISGKLKNKPIYSRQILLGIGAPENNFASNLQGKLGYVQDVYRADIEETIKQSAISRKKSGEALRVAILGGGPTAAEIAYRCLVDPTLNLYIDRLFVLTTSGKLPNGTNISLDTSGYKLFELEQLKQIGYFGADALISALRADISKAEQDNVPLLNIRSMIKETFKSLFSCMSINEKRNFVIRYGEHYVSLMKYTASDYSDVLQNPNRDRKIVIYQAFVESLQWKNNCFELTMRDKSGSSLALNADVVFNCLGPRDLSNLEESLIKRLLDRNLIRVNESGRGIAVNEFFEANPNLFVLGPLLAGTCVGEQYIMRLKSIDGIYELSQTISKNILKVAEANKKAR